MGSSLLYACVSIMLVVLGYILYLKQENKEKVNTILYRSLGGMLLLSYFASVAIFGDDELGILGLICYAWTFVMSIILFAKLFMKNENFWKTLILYGLILCPFALFHIEVVAIVAVFMVICFIYETIAKFIKDKLQDKFPYIFNGLATLSLYLFLVNIFLFIGIAVYDHRIFGYIKPFWR